MKRSIIILFILLFTHALIAADLSADEVMQQVLAVQNSDSSALDLRLTLIEANGQRRERRIQTISQTKEGKTSTLTVFLSPESVRNTRFLSLEQDGGTTEQWIYLPALKRVRRIGASEEGGSFMGSDFSYADMASTTYDADEATHSLLSSQGDSYQIASLPDAPTTYGKLVTTVDKRTFLPLRVEFYDLDGKTLLKTLVTETIAEIGGRPIAKTMVMTSIFSGHATRLEILDAKYDLALNPGYFTVTFLETGRLI
ncbi:MAG: outer membrane lipoprotein-sorting protein [Sphaerochaeta sp.]|jgi:hypothetical protein|uniref:outer membrane lipoprotein-sorting protein n=1 Tax=Sphaerochaeta sp. TaxID=1972642 RepID=UPI002FC72F3A